MAEVATVDGVSIQIRYGSGARVFYAVTNHGQAIIEIDTFNMVTSTLPKSVLERILQWAKSRSAALQREWSRANSGQIVGTIS